MKCNTKSNAKQLSLTNPIPNQQACEYTIRAYSTRVCQVEINEIKVYIELLRENVSGSVASR